MAGTSCRKIVARPLWRIRSRQAGPLDQGLLWYGGWVLVWVGIMAFMIGWTDRILLDGADRAWAVIESVGWLCLAIAGVWIVARRTRIALLLDDPEADWEVAVDAAAEREAWSPERSIAGANVEVGVDRSLAAAVVLGLLHWSQGGEPGGKALAAARLSYGGLLVGLGLLALAPMARHLRFGPSRVRFAGFPFCLGGSLEVIFERLDRLRAARALEIHLRCYEESPRERTRDPTLANLQTVLLYEERRRYNSTAEALVAASAEAPASEAHSEDGRELPIRFFLPDAPRLSTRLRALPVRYWELEVRAELPGPDYRAVFLLPVFARST